MLLCQHGKGERVGDGPPPVRTVGGSRLILRLFTFKLKRKKKLPSISKAILIILSIFLVGARFIVFCTLRDIFHIPSSNLILTLQGKYYANKTCRDSKSMMHCNTLVAEE